MILLKKLVALLPLPLQSELRRFHCARNIKKNSFSPDEPEFELLDQFIRNDDWVIDIGANVGHYSKKFSELVGNQGRVFAFEPIPDTFTILSSNTMLFAHQNVTLFNVAVSDCTKTVGMSIPKFNTGLNNYYQAKIDENNSTFHVLTFSIDSLNITNKIALVKIDAENHELQVINGMLKLIEKNLPVLIIETGCNKIVNLLLNIGYSNNKIENSPNILFLPPGLILN